MFALQCRAVGTIGRKRLQRLSYAMPHFSTGRSHATHVLVIVSSMPRLGWAQRDMVGFDLLALLGALPSLVLHALGELALVLLALLLLVAVIAWVASRFQSVEDSKGERPSTLLRYLRGPLPVVAMTIVVGAAALFHVASGGPGGSSKGERLQSPSGKAWPDKTGYLDMPQSPSNGTGVIKLTHRSSGGRVYVKLCEAGEGSCPGLRHAIIQKFGEFEFRGLPAGSFEIRMIYIDPPIVAGKSRPVRIEEGSGEAVVLRLPAQPVLNSNDPIYGVPKEQF